MLRGGRRHRPWTHLWEPGRRPRQPFIRRKTKRPHTHSATLEGGPPPQGSVLTPQKPQGHRAFVGWSARERGRQGWARAGEGTCRPHRPPVWGGASTEAEVGSVSISLRAPATHQTSPLPACLLCADWAVVGTRPSTQRSMGTGSAAPGPAFPTHTLSGLGQAVEYLGDGWYPHEAGRSPLERRGCPHGARDGPQERGAQQPGHWENGSCSSSGWEGQVPPLLPQGPPVLCMLGGCWGHTRGTQKTPASSEHLLTACHCPDPISCLLPGLAARKGPSTHCQHQADPRGVPRAGPFPAPTQRTGSIPAHACPRVSPAPTPTPRTVKAEPCVQHPARAGPWRAPVSLSRINELA